MQAKRLTAYVYQDLIDQGWRRSGTYLYKPDLARSCCKAYTIRLDVQQFTPDKGQRRLLRKWRGFLEGNLGSGSAEAGAGTGGGTGTAAISGSHVATSPTDANNDDAGSAGLSRGLDPGASQFGHRSGCELRDEVGRDHEPLPSSIRAATFVAGAATRMTAAAAEEQALQQLLAAALATAVEAGELPAAPPAAPYAPPAVRRCSAKQRQALPPDVCYTSAAAFSLAVVMARRGEGAAAAAATSSSTAGGDEKSAAQHNGNVTVATGAAAGGREAADRASGPQQWQKPQRKPLPLPDDALSAHNVAAVLARHFNSLAVETQNPGGGDTAAAGRCAAAALGGASGKVSTAGTLADGKGPAGPMATAAVTAAVWQHTAARPEAFAANGHVNFRLPSSCMPQCAAAAAAVGLGRGGAARTAAAKPVGGTKAPRPSCSGARCAAGGCSGGSGDPNAPEGATGASTGAAGPRNRKGPPPAADTAVTARRQPAPDKAPRPGPAPAPDSLAMPGGRLEIRLVPSQFLQEEFELYKRYQVAQHEDEPWEVQPDSFSRFLVESPLPHVGRDSDPAAPECGYGSFHQQYRLDGKLIAVGVVDVLPRCLSSVYFFWDPDLAPLALGRFSALQEIGWVQRAMASCPSLHFYYMGFYIHTCPKMRYKAEYRPSDLLCPRRKVWVRITPQLLAAISEHPFLELSAQDGVLCQPNLAAPETDGGGGGGSVEDTLVDYQDAGVGGVLRFQDLRRLNIVPRRLLGMIGEAIGKWREAVGWTASSLVYELR